MTPLISVIICTRNRAQALRETLAHYRHLQFDRWWELVLVDNNSTDDTPLVIDEFVKSELPIRPTRCVNIGLGAAREHGRVFASGRILLFTDDDCYPDVNLLEAYCSIFEEIPSLGFCGGRILLWDETDILLTVDYRDKPETYPPHQFIVPGSLQGANLLLKQMCWRQ